MINRTTVPVSTSSKTSKKVKSQEELFMPSILSNDRQLPDITEDVMEATRKANTPPKLFIRGGELVTIHQDEWGLCLIVKCTNNVLRGHIARAAKFHKKYFDKEGEERTIECPPPMEVIKDVAAMNPALLEIPPLEGLVQIPTFRSDGSIIQNPGYDRTTGLVFIPDPKVKLPAISPCPTRSEITRAKSLINEALCDFPLVDCSSRANSVAGMLTSTIRPAIQGRVPLLLVDATTQGTGKTLYCEMTSIVTTGHAASLLSPPHDKEEWRRILTSILIEGRTNVIFDNVNQPLDSAELCIAITAEYWSDRRIQSSTALRLPVRCSWYANGNNLQLGGDMARRCYLVRMDAKCSRPFERGGFKHPDLKGWVKINRGQIVWALLTLTSAWYAAKCPTPNVPLLGGFEEWTRVIGGVLENAGIPGFLGNRTELYEHADQESSQWESFLLALFEYRAGKSFRLAEIEHELQANRRLSDTLPDEIVSFIKKPGSLTRKLGSKFSEKRGRRFGDSGVFVERDGVYQHAILWKVTCPHPTQR
jgi:hypothetical protein